MNVTVFRNSRRRGLAAGGRAQRRFGFTLVEMLVAVGLVVLMMSLFAQIFQIATQSMQKQKATGELDQKARIVETLLRADLNSRTFRMLAPFKANENTAALNANMDLRRGYFYIAENVVSNDTDDVLQLTVDKRLGPTPDSTPFYGRTITLKDSYGSINAPNQPQFDDGQIAADNAGSSPTAEVAYFLRNGTLYRRVLLIRQPLIAADPVNDADPEGTGSSAPFPPGVTISGSVLDDMKLYQRVSLPNGTTPRNFWTDFDYSAYPGPSTFPGAGSVITPQFHSQGDLNNAQGGSLVSCLGLPQYRFGYSDISGSTFGNPIEYVGTSPNTAFIGRFTKEETSNLNFVYPGSFVSPGTVDTSAPVAAPTVANLTVANGVVNQYAGGIRAGEDILLTNVTAFDIKVWDPRTSFGSDGQPGFAANSQDPLGNVLGLADDNLNGVVNDVYETGWPGSDDGAFVDLGHQTIVNGNQIGFYNRQAVQNPNYSPLNGYRFDTWHPQVDIWNTAGGAAGSDGIYEQPPFRPMSFGIDRKPGIAGVNDNQNYYNPPSYNYDPVTMPAPIIDYDYNSPNAPPDYPIAGDTTHASEVDAPGSDDMPIPLSAVQIRIRYFDTTSKQTREITMVVSLQN